MIDLLRKAICKIESPSTSTVRAEGAPAATYPCPTNLLACRLFIHDTSVRGWLPDLSLSSIPARGRNRGCA
ncbi:hypothetical protein Mapa_005017 [Marchantia paleacea]|nr:hypothetical protein Mapa_005017 [Marchantia paleacea]